MIYLEQQVHVAYALRQHQTLEVSVSENQIELGRAEEYGPVQTEELHLFPLGPLQDYMQATLLAPFPLPD